jgi:ABC-type antimicrobial peptide transport system ATPase subunit
MSAPILSVRELKVHFPIPAGGFLQRRYIPLKAVDGVSFDLAAGETLGIVGESGCGKSTLGRALLQLIPPTDGQVIWLGQNLAGQDSGAMRRYRRDLQIIFQDPLASLDPRMPVGEIIAEPLTTHEPGLGKAEIRARVQQMMRAVGLLPQMLHRATLADDLQSMRRLGAHDCIDCGLCDYVCPSQIPLASRFRAARRTLRIADESARRANAAKVSYERREQRLRATAAAEQQALDAARSRAGQDRDAAAGRAGGTD